MSKYQQQYLTALRGQCNYYRQTAKGRAAGTPEYVRGLSQYLYDVFTMCAGGIGELELRQFMPPASLQASVSSLLELGLIECVRHIEREAANRHVFEAGRMAA
jgi:hypothetical protein